MPFAIFFKANTHFVAVIVTAMTTRFCSAFLFIAKKLQFISLYDSMFFFINMCLDYQ